MRRRVFSVALLTILVGPLNSSITAPAVQASVPPYQVATQFISKLYTEGLGRAPDAASWATIENDLIARGCSPSVLGHWGKVVYKSAEFASLYPLPDPSGNKYINAARVLALVRGGLNREPDWSLYSSLFLTLNGSQTQTTWNSQVDNVFNGAAFSSLVTGTICPANDSRRDPTAYYWNTTNQPILGASKAWGATCGFGTGTTQATIQAALDSAGPGGTVLLAQGAEIFIDGNYDGAHPYGDPANRGLTIPAGVTLRTCQPGDPGMTGLPSATPYNYTLMARLYRVWNRTIVPAATWWNSVDAFNNSMVVNWGGTLKNVWVDGGRNSPINVCTNSPGVSYYTGAASHGVGHCSAVFMMGGHGTSTIANRLDNSGANYVLHAEGATAQLYCTAQNKVQNNVITGYASSHFPIASHPNMKVWQDGISSGCENAEISGNQIVDATDVPLILFRVCVPAVPGGQPTESRCSNAPPSAFVMVNDVHHNTILSAGNSAYGAVWISPFDAPGPGWQYGVADYTGTSVHDNAAWTGVNTHFDQLYLAGIRIAHQNADYSRRGKGASFVNNHTANQIAYTQEALAISGMTEVTITGNDFSNVRVAGAGFAGFPSTWSRLPFTCPTISAAGGPAVIIGEFTSYEAGYPDLWWASGTISGNILGPGLAQYYDSPGTAPSLAVPAAGPNPVGCLAADDNHAP